MNITTIIFDLDDTLYSADTGVWSLIRERIDLYMVEKLGYLVDQVSTSRETFFNKYGTTLRGLQEEHHIETTNYLEFVHDIPLTQYLSPNPALLNLLNNLPQRKVIFTNSDRWHTQRVLNVLGVAGQFELVIDILDVSPYCKPMQAAFELALKKLEITNYSQCLLVDDNLKNINAAKNMGLNTIWVSENFHEGILQIKNILELESVLAKLMEKQ